MTWLAGLNAALAFAIELCMVWAYGFWGWRASAVEWLRWVLAAGLPLVSIGLWARWGAPKSGTRLRAPWLWCFEWLMFAGAAGALYAAGRERFAVGYLIVASGNLAASAYFARAARPGR